MTKVRLAVPVLVATLAVIAPGMPGGSPASAAMERAPATTEDRESIVVSGTGQASGEPDTLVANFAVETGAATVADALSRATAAATKMRDALVRAGTAKADLQTSDVSITSRRNDAQEITGYTVTQGLTARIRNLPKAGATMSAAVTAGGDAARLNGVSFEIEDDAALLTQARKKAFAQARAKAELYAREAGRPLGRVVKVTEQTPGYWASAEQKGLSMADLAMPIEPGRQRLSVTITVEWALGALPAGKSSGLG